MPRRKFNFFIFVVLVVLGLWWLMRPQPSPPVPTPTPAPAKPSPLHSLQNQNPFVPPPTKPAAPAPTPPGSSATHINDETQSEQSRIDALPVEFPQFNGETQSYHLDPSELAVIMAEESAASAGRTSTNPSNADEILTDVLSRAGVNFPPGSRMVYISTLGDLEVTDTPENLAKIPNALRTLLYDPPPPPSPQP